LGSLLYWILAILTFSLVVIVHELGHFGAARLTGTGVMEFAIGFGPKLWARKAKSGVLYSLRALPFGGYCRFVSEDEPGCEDREDSYYRQAVWRRALISVAGPLMNVLMAVALIFLIYCAVGLPGVEPVIGGLMPGLPAEQAGFQAGDRIVSVNGVAVETAAEVSQGITAAGDTDIAFGIRRGAEEITLRAQPRWVEAEGRGMIGIEYKIVRFRLGLWESFKNSWIVTGNMATEIFRVLRNLIFKGEGIGELSGPIGTVVIIKEQTQQGGLLNYMQLAAIISVNLGLFNMLPVPGLDGSKLIFLAIEKVRGKRMNPNKEGAVLLIGFALMVCLMALAMYQDIVRLLT